MKDDATHTLIAETAAYVHDAAVSYARTEGLDQSTVATFTITGLIVALLSALSTEYGFDPDVVARRMSEVVRR